jgi:hypothetical protein
MTFVTGNWGKCRRNSLYWCGAGLLAAILSCTSADAQDSRAASTPLFPGFRTTVPEPPDWVKKSRPSQEALYDRRAPVPAAEPDGAPMSPDQLRKVEAEMNALRRGHERAGGLPKAHTGRSAALEPQKRKERSKPGCVLTCNIGLGRVTGK